ncbi:MULTISPECIES: phage holin family protein [Micrococcaceae]|uniref:phage holin family protein n=1 Tax=Micrococcaceae TaxID=1268 RepID=UPI002096B5DB|nr:MULTISPECIES: phage holin family protein [Micrococcaceae]MDD1478225.1 phage holin family protein [Arthrobacter sp. H16F315]MDJ0352134.1 phage holin family protein [Pseudarthrobacter sp. PH31-O2]
MSGRHSGGTTGAPRISALPKTLKLIFKLAPRQLNDEIALAKVEIKRKGIQVGVAAAVLAVALIFVAFLVIGLIVAAIMGLATIMPAWLAALLVCAVFLLIAAIAGLVGVNKFKKAMPLVPADTIRGLKYDLGIAKEGSAFDAALLDPSSAQFKAAKAAKAEAAAKAKAEKEAKKAAEPDFGPPPTESELRRRLDQRRAHLTGVRDELNAELDVKPQARALLTAAQAKLQNGKEQLGGKVAGFRSAVGHTPASSAVPDGSPTGAAGMAADLGQRWKPLVALAASAAAMVFLLRKLLKG